MYFITPQLPYNIWSMDYVRRVENPEIIIKLAPDEALVLSDWL